MRQEQLSISSVLFSRSVHSVTTSIHARWQLHLTSRGHPDFHTITSYHGDFDSLGSLYFLCILPHMSYSHSMPFIGSSCNGCANFSHQPFNHPPTGLLTRALSREGILKQGLIDYRLPLVHCVIRGDTIIDYHWFDKVVFSGIFGGLLGTNTFLSLFLPPGKASFLCACHF
jgi:hypothetical protein